jgi:hypothetical protein
LGEGRIRKITHIDTDVFYAFVEQRDNPALKGKPSQSATRRNAAGRDGKLRGPPLRDAMRGARVFGRRDRGALVAAQTGGLIKGEIEDSLSNNMESPLAVAFHLFFCGARISSLAGRRPPRPDTL